MAGFLEGVVWDRDKQWRGMPEFGQEDLSPYQSVRINLTCPEDRESLAKHLGQKIGPPGRFERTLWWPKHEKADLRSKRFISEVPILPHHPVYIVSKGRWESRLTAKALEEMSVPYRIIVEEHQHEQYAAVIDPSKILTLPKKYQRDYETCDDLGDTKSKGPGAARNFAWDHSISLGAKWHWVMDDNINGFYRLCRNMKHRVVTGAVFLAMEEFVGRYENVAIAGPNYCMFVPRKWGRLPYLTNTRIYSCLLIRNDIPYRWRGRYNEDTDLSLRALKDEWCTVQFNAFLQNKVTTQTIKGGCTEEFYRHEGTLPKSRILFDMHPDVTKVVIKYGRHHHHVDYTRFKRNKLKLKCSLDQLHEVDNFGMYLEHVKDVPLLLIGQAPGKGDGGPLEGRIGKRLAALAGISQEEYVERTERMNLLPHYPGENGKGDAFDPEEAARRALALMGEIKGRRVLFLGRSVAQAFGFGKKDLPILTWLKSPSLDADVAVMPHPSGIVHWWNDEDNREAASQFLTMALNNHDEINTDDEEEAT